MGLVTMLLADRTLAGLKIFMYVMEQNIFRFLLGYLKDI
jgi:hypothetical protein